MSTPHHVHMSDVTCHVSCVRCHMSGVRYQVSGVKYHVTYKYIFFSDKVVGLGGRSVIDGAYPVQLKYFWILHALFRCDIVFFLSKKLLANTALAVLLHLVRPSATK